ncbi:hypothetical protein Q2K19_07775 [Micromonospora soli]|uniref:hypothetical protein n=1 Tax=Micromonospora sp. NBRC 110009 TaxID=3061627 RepID=UPI0026731087|nr:hypothetical protein [Micromonospora sp. NBRC 110009]WKU00366.1 hypothetical protein Q2K19_07775 [Micromonospora sp. NBRC 110009]
MSVSGPAVAPAQPRRAELWSRRLLALVAGGAVAALAARVLLAIKVAGPEDIGGLVWVTTGVHLAQQRWRPRRDGRLVWRARVSGRYGTEPGLVAGRSAAGWVELVAGRLAGTTLAVGVISTLPAGWDWVGVGRPVLLGAVALGLGQVAYREVRFTGRLALTASGLRYGSAWYAWTEVEDARPNSRNWRDGVWLRLDPGRLLPQVVGGRSVAVSDERLLAAIEQFRRRPEVLAVGLPVAPPEPVLRSAGG